MLADTYLRTMPFGFGAIYRGYQGEPVSHELYFPSFTNEIIATATWQAPFLAVAWKPGIFSVVPYLVAPIAPAATTVVVAASATAMVHHLYHMDESDPNHDLMQMIGSNISL